MDILKPCSQQQFNSRLLTRSIAMAAFIIFLLAQAYTPLSAQESKISLLDYTLRDLKSSSTQTLASYRGKPVLMIFFEPDCNWCFKQIRLLNQMQTKTECENSFQALAIGINGSRRRLLAESRRLDANFPTLQASTEMLADLGELPGTPVLIFSNADGFYHAHYFGYQNEISMFALLNDIGINCAAASLV